MIIDIQTSPHASDCGPNPMHNASLMIKCCETGNSQHQKQFFPPPAPQRDIAPFALT